MNGVLQSWQLDLDEAIVHGDSVIERSEHGARLTTPSGQWSYCVSVTVPDEIRAANAKLIVSVKADIFKGVLGLGVVTEDHSTYISEEQFRPGDVDISVLVPAAKIAEAFFIVMRNAAPSSVQTEFNVSGIEVSTTFAADAASLASVTNMPFRPRADRNAPFKVASINTTEVCNLSCVMCHFNGPNATKKSGALQPDQVEKALRGIPIGEVVWFCATGEFFIDTNAVSYLRLATSLGLKPCVLTHGQLFNPELMDDVLAAGVRLIRMSVDSTDEAQYRKIRRGGELRNIVEACKYLRRKKLGSHPDLRVEINATLFKNTFDRQREMEDFWRGLVDQVNFNAEYFNTLSFRNLFFIPQRRVDCDIQLYIMPSGRIAPCCAMAVYQHEHDVTWLPHIDNITSLQAAHEQLCDLYEDPKGPMASICSKCDWWILSMSGNSPYIRAVNFDSASNK